MAVIVSSVSPLLRWPELGRSHAIPPRDRTLDFGKHRGRMLGLLPLKYLRWMEKDLHDTKWSDLAKQVLDDPHFHDRLEWLKLEQTLLKHKGGNGEKPTQERLMRAAGWDVDNHMAWKGVDFSLLGTTKGGKIPRKNIGRMNAFEDSVLPKKVKKVDEDLMQRRRMRRNRVLALADSEQILQVDSTGPNGRPDAVGNVIEEKAQVVSAGPQERPQVFTTGSKEKHPTGFQAKSQITPATEVVVSSRLGPLFPGRDTMLKKFNRN